MLFIIIILIFINTIIIGIIIIDTISIIVIVIFTMTTHVFITNRLQWNAAKSTRESLRSKLTSINSAAEEEAVTALRTPTGGCGSFDMDILISKDLGCGLMDLALVTLSGTIKILTIPAQRMIVVRKDRNSRGEGVAMFIRDGIPFKTRMDITDNNTNCESFCLLK